MKRLITIVLTLSLSFSAQANLIVELTTAHAIACIVITNHTHIQGLRQPAHELVATSKIFRIAVGNNKVIVALRGACSSCPSAGITLRYSVEQKLKEFVSDDLEVVEEK